MNDHPIHLALDHLKHMDQFKELVTWIEQGYGNTIEELIEAPSDQREKLVGKMAAFKEILELFTWK